jgi:copper transport protein
VKGARRLTGVVLALLGGALTVLVTAGPASAHASLVDTHPAAGSVLAHAPATVRLTFTEPVQVTAGAVGITGPDGHPVDGLDPAADPDDGSTLVAHLPRPLPEGTYAVAWRVISLDGHPVTGSFAFAVGSVSAPLRPADASTLTGPGLVGGTGRALAAAGALSVAGLAAFPLLVLAPARRRLRGIVPGLDADARRRLRRPLVVAGAVAAAGTVVVLVDTAADTGSSLLEVSAGTRTGWLLVGRLVALAVTVAALTVPARLGARARTTVALGGSAATLLTFSLASHAAAAAVDRPAALAFDFAHLVAAGVWTGGLLALALAGLPAARAAAGGNRNLVGDGAAALSGSFSVVAQVAMVAVLVTGLYPSVLQVAGLSDLGATGWGLALTAKVTVWASVLLFAAANAFTFVPALSSRAGAAARRLAAVDQLRSAVRVELGLAGALIVAAALMSASPQPSQERAVAAQQEQPRTVQATATGSAGGYVATVRAVRSGTGTQAPTVFGVVLTTEDTPASAPGAAATLTGPDGAQRRLPLQVQGAGTWSAAGVLLEPGDYRLSTRFDRTDRTLTIPVDVEVPATPLPAVGVIRAEELARARTALQVSLAGVALSAVLAGLVAAVRRRRRLVPVPVLPAVPAFGPAGPKPSPRSTRRQRQ